MRPAAQINILFLFVYLVLGLIGGCSWFPSAGPSATAVVEQGQAGDEILFDVVPVDDRVVSTLLAQPRESFALRFKKDTQPPEIKIAVGDTISVLIWESAAGGLFSEAPSLTSPGATPGTEPLAPEAGPPSGKRRGEFGAPSPPFRQPPGGTNRPEGRQPARAPPSSVAFDRRGGVHLPLSPRRRSGRTVLSASPTPAEFPPPGDHRQRCSKR